MKRLTFSLLIAILSTFSLAIAQQLSPFPNGDYSFKKIKYSDEKYSPLPAYPSEVESSGADRVQINFPISNGGSWSHRSGGYFHRMKGNIFAEHDSDGLFKTNPKAILILREGEAMEVYRIKNKQKTGLLLVAGQGANMKEIKAAAKLNFEAFDAQKIIAEMEGINAEIDKARIAAEAKAAAEKAAQEKAEAEALAAERANADLCTPIKRFATLAGSNFTSLKGERDAAESELEDEDIFRSSEMLPLFAQGLILPTYIDDNMRLTFRTQAFYKQADAAAELAFIKGELDPCFKNKGGYTASEDSGIFFYKKGKLTIAFGSKKDYDDDGDTIHLVFLTVDQR